MPSRPGARLQAVEACKIWLPIDRVRSQDLQAGIRYELLRLARRVLQVENSKCCGPKTAQHLAPIRLELLRLASEWWQCPNVRQSQNGIFEFQQELEGCLKHKALIQQPTETTLTNALLDLL